MELDLFKYLPPEIIINILSRLPVRTIASSKCVCKPWLDLLETDYFVNSHLAKSVPSLAVMIGNRPWRRCKVVEFEDELESHDFRLTEFDFPKKTFIVSGANGLLLLSKLSSPKDILYICNPITRHYVEILGPKQECSLGKFAPLGAYGFGASRISGQFKVVRINHISECYVYTLGTGSWRRICIEAARPSVVLKDYSFFFGAFVDGHLYWMVTPSTPMITCFDLETECFSSFSAPSSRGGLSVLRDSLYFCEWKDEIVVWLMKEYGAEKSWSKDYVISHSRVTCAYDYRAVYPLKVFQNGDMLMIWDDHVLLYYSNKTKTIQQIGSFDDPKDDYACITSITLTPSFLSLKCLGMENVISF